MTLTPVGFREALRVVMMRPWFWDGGKGAASIPQSEGRDNGKIGAGAREA